MSKDRAAPFSKKHRMTWIPVLGGMILIGIINLVLGALSYSPPPARNDKIQLVIPKSPYAHKDAGIDAPSPVDAGVAPTTAK